MISQNSFIFALFAASLPVLANEVKIVNSCKDPINFYVNKKLEGNLAVGASAIHDIGLDGRVLVHTDAYGGSPDMTGSTAAGILGDLHWYYIVQDPTHFNTPVSISVNQTEKNGFCVVDSCLTASCANSFTYAPAHNPGQPSADLPDPPYYACNNPNAGLQFTVTFCTINPGDAPAPIVPATLHPNGDPNKCIDVQGGLINNGAPLQIYDCNETSAQKWNLRQGEEVTRVQLDGTEYCLDAGSSPQNGTALTIAHCDPKSTSQQWWFTWDNAIALTTKLLCLDLTDGDTTNGNPIKLATCTWHNKEQVWTAV